MRGMAYRIIKRIFRNVEVSKDLLHRMVDSMDFNDDGRVSLSEFVIALKILWRKAMGKEKAPKKPKVRTVD